MTAIPGFQVPTPDGWAALQMDLHKVSAVPDASNPAIVTLFNVRLAYVRSLFEPRQQKRNDGSLSDPAYSVVPIIHNSNAEALAAVQGAMWAVAQSKWGKDAAAVWQALSAQSRLATQPGAAKAGKGPQWHEATFLNASRNANKGAPELLHEYALPGSQAPAPITADQRGKLYDGVRANVQVKFWPQDNQDGGKRINAELLAVQYEAEAPRFSSGDSDARPVLTAFRVAPAVPSVLGGAPVLGVIPGVTGAPVPGVVTAPPAAAPAVDQAALLAAFAAQQAQAQAQAAAAAVVAPAPVVVAPAPVVVAPAPVAPAPVVAAPAPVAPAALAGIDPAVLAALLAQAQAGAAQPAATVAAL